MSKASQPFSISPIGRRAVLTQALVAGAAFAVPPAIAAASTEAPSKLYLEAIALNERFFQMCRESGHNDDAVSTVMDEAQEANRRFADWLNAQSKPSTASLVELLVLMNMRCCDESYGLLEEMADPFEERALWAAVAKISGQKLAGDRS
jgi:hypothetical protein